MYCPKCGTKNPEGAAFCENCGNRLIDPQAASVDRNYGEKKHSNVLVILGYIFAIISGIIGAIIGLYLYTRDDSYYKAHGRNILIIAVIIIVIGVGATAYTLYSLSNQPQISINNTTLSNENNGTQSNETNNQTDQTDTSTSKSITSSQAQSIAQSFAQPYVPGAYAGTPTLSGNTYIVRLYGNGAVVGEVSVNQNGAVVGYWFNELPSSEDFN